jgi:hypothetical protein
MTPIEADRLANSYLKLHEFKASFVLRLGADVGTDLIRSAFEQRGCAVELRDGPQLYVQLPGHRSSPAV